jgi:hypothetical protein
MEAEKKMLSVDQVEELIDMVAGLDRPELIQQFRSYHAVFPLDFTDDFLASLPIDRLRHIFVALCLQSKQMPEIAA